MKRVMPDSSSYTLKYFQHWVAVNFIEFIVEKQDASLYGTNFPVYMLRYNPEQNISEIIDWCENHPSNNRFMISDVSQIYFEDPKDAMMFKLWL